MNSKQLYRLRRKSRIRKVVSGTKQRPRLSVFRSNKFIYAQLIDDVSGVTIVSATDKGMKRMGNKQSMATKVGESVAELAKKSDITSVVFDRNGYAFQGRVKAVAEGARSQGLVF